MNQFKNLIVWQKSIELATEIYKLTDAFPTKEKFGLVTQMNRCAVSISSNLAEGAGRNSNKEYCYFLSISQGSSFELETQLLIGLNLKYYTQKELNPVMTLLHEVQKMLYSLQSKLGVVSIKY